MAIRLTLLTTLLALLLTGYPSPAAAAPDSPLQISERGGGVQIAWRGSVAASPAGPALAGWPERSFGGAHLPAQIIALRLDGPAALRIERAESAAWRGALRPAPLARPPASASAPAELLTPPEQGLPDAPVTLLRQGRMRGATVAVVAVSPVFATPGGLRAATQIRAFVPGARLLRESAETLLSSPEPFLSAAAGPRNQAAGGPAWRVTVARGGLQRLSAAALGAAGVDLSDPARLHLRRAGAEQALEQRGGPAGLDELRFYAPPPGDRWNSTDTYWLTLETAPGLRMATRDARPASDTPSRTTAVERGLWRKPAEYDSKRPGPSGDHWFAGRLSSAGGPPITATLDLAPSLPLDPAGSLQLTVEGAAGSGGAHLLRASAGGASAQAVWSGADLWEQSLTLPNTSATVILQRPADERQIDVLIPDRIGWERPVQLVFGGQGGQFSSVPGQWVYQLSGAPAGATLYDITSPNAPVLLTTGGDSFMDSAGADAPHSYLLAAPAGLAEPRIAAWQAHDFSTPADTLYIAPAPFQSALAPLVALRQQQGHSVRLIDLQSIYDAWSDGQVAPQAIRSFLRYSAAAWSPAPSAVTLVGDGTVDPRDYFGHHNTNFIPPYMADVDLWLGETACETCYAQLDGDDPLGAGDPLPDLRLGRLPVNSAAELERLVAKISAYELDAPGGLWRARNVFVTDNTYEADGSPDPAGDFFSWSDAAVALQPRDALVRRVYYDPWGRDRQGAPLSDPGHIGRGIEARKAVLSALEEGAGLINYTGHSSNWQWAITELDANPNSLLGLYDPDNLTNSPRLPIVLEMTCLTAAFQTPAPLPTTLDERLLLSKAGGAVAVWGPTGLSIAESHSMLQRGFYRALWAAPPQQADLGALTAAGYLELFSQADRVGIDAIQSFVLLGDPLTRARVTAAHQIYTPIVRR
jgi:hypothetical protein